MKDLNFTNEQIKQILFEKSKEIGINEVLKFVFESMMNVEREIYKTETGDVSNGYRKRNFLGEGKILELQVPRTRQSGFYPILLGLLKDQQQESLNLALTLYQKGLTDSEIGDVFEQLYGKHYSRSRISQIVNEVQEDIDLWRKRELEEYYPVLYIDAIYQYVRYQGSVKKIPFYIILGVKEDYTREVLSIEAFPSESSVCWEELFVELKKRGVAEVSLIVSDALNGIENAITKVFNSDHQLCVTHLKRNVLAKVSKKDREEIAKDLKEVFRTTDKFDSPEKGWKRWNEFIDKWIKKYPYFVNYKDDRYRLHFTYLNYNYQIRSMIYTTNWIERLNRDFRRVSKMRASMPTIESVLGLYIGVAKEKKAYRYKVSNFEFEDKKFGYESPKE